MEPPGNKRVCPTDAMPTQELLRYFCHLCLINPDRRAEPCDSQIHIERAIAQARQQSDWL